MTEDHVSLEPEVTDVRQRADGVDIDLLVSPDILYLQGHFPELPVVPGVAQIDWAVVMADRFLGTDIGAATNFKVKFRSIIRPPIALTLELRITARETGGTRRLTFEYLGSDGAFSTGAIQLGLDE